MTKELRVSFFLHFIFIYFLLFISTFSFITTTQVWVKEIANSLVTQGHLQACVNVVDSNGTQMNFSLTNLIRVSFFSFLFHLKLIFLFFQDLLMAEPQRWWDQILGQSYGNQSLNQKMDPVCKIIHKKAKLAKKELQQMISHQFLSPSSFKDINFYFFWFYLVHHSYPRTRNGQSWASRACAQSGSTLIPCKDFFQTLIKNQETKKNSRFTST